MNRPTFGDPQAIARFTPNTDHVYPIYELVDLGWCPQALKDAYHKALTLLDDADACESMDMLGFASEAIHDAEAALREWGRAQGYRVETTGVLEGEVRL
jgi:hypothetical protein